MLADELLDPAGAAAGWGPMRVAAELEAARRSRNYGDATFMDDQLRMVDLIPRRVTTFILLFLAGLVVVAGLELAYSWVSTPAMLEITSDGGPIAAFDLDSEGSLAVWFSSVAFLSAISKFIFLSLVWIQAHVASNYGVAIMLASIGFSRAAGGTYSGRRSPACSRAAR